MIDLDRVVKNAVTNDFYAEVAKRRGTKPDRNVGETVLNEVKVLQKLLVQNKSYLYKEMQVDNGEKIEGMKGEKYGTQLNTLYNEFQSNVSHSKIVLWDSDIWTLAHESTVGLIGEVFTEEMWARVEPQLWAWNGSWQTSRWPCYRHGDMKLVPTFPQYAALFPVCLDEEKMIMQYDVLLADISEGHYEITRERMLPYLSVRILQVGDTLMSKDMYRECFFLNQKIVQEKPAHFDRASRKRLARMQDDPGRVRTILLRRMERKETHDASGREYKHQWIVSGHTRQQWYPSTQEYKVIFIDPYLKGPEGAPLLPSKGSLYLAGR